MSGDVCVDQLGSLVVSTSQDELSHGILPRPPVPLPFLKGHYFWVFSLCVLVVVGGEKA